MSGERCVILWYPPDRNEWDQEWYDTRAEAEKALAEFREEYPWNTYFLAVVVEIVEASQEWPAPKITVVRQDA